MKGRTGWTFVEVLVAMAIIALLAGLLFPVMHTAEKSAKSAACLNNLSQIGKATALYVADYDDWYPASLNAWDKYGTSTGERFPHTPAFHEAVGPYLRANLVFLCPEDRIQYYVAERSIVVDTMYDLVGSSYLTHHLPYGLPMTEFTSPNTTVAWHSTGRGHREARAWDQVVSFQVHADWHVSASRFVGLR